MLNLTSVFHKNVEAYKAGKKFIINSGGSRSSKTFSILQLFTTIASKYQLQIDVAGISMPHLKRGVLNDMPKVMEGFGLNFYEHFNSTDKILTFPSGGRINFIALDKIGTAHGGARDILFINEANHHKKPIVDQLVMRTAKCTFIDFNPTSRFWAHELAEDKKNDAAFIHSTYKDNEFCPPNIVEYLESRRGDGQNNFWRVYGLGEIGISEGLVFNNFEVKDFNPLAFSQYRNGVDWGFSSDPFAYVRLAIEQNTLYVCKEIYMRGLLNEQSAAMVKQEAGREVVFCDSTEPKSIAEYRSLGINAMPVKKGAGSIESGIKRIQAFDKVVIHPDCSNIADEFRNYQWKVDKTGNALPMPIDAFNHGIDAIRYALENDMKYSNTKLVGMRPF